MGKRLALVVLVSSLLLGISGPVFADTAVPTRADQITAIQDQYNPIFDSEYARLLVLKKKVLADASMTKNVVAQIKDFLDVRRVINEGLVSSTSDLPALKAYAEEETGEFASNIGILETQAATLKTITCIKAKVVKKVSGTAPKCPKGYKKK